MFGKAPLELNERIFLICQERIFQSRASFFEIIWEFPVFESNKVWITSSLILLKNNASSSSSSTIEKEY